MKTDLFLKYIFYKPESGKEWGFPQEDTRREAGASEEDHVRMERASGRDPGLSSGQMYSVKPSSNRARRGRALVGSVLPIFLRPVLPLPFREAWD